MNTIKFGWKWFVELFDFAEGDFVEPLHSSVPMSEFVNLQRRANDLEAQLARAGVELRESVLKCEAIEEDLDRLTEVAIGVQLENKELRVQVNSWRELATR